MPISLDDRTWELYETWNEEKNDDRWTFKNIKNTAQSETMTVEARPAQEETSEERRRIKL